MAVDYTCRLPNPAGPVVDLQTGAPTVALWHWMLAMFKRTGDADPGIGTVDAATLAAAAQTAATAASGAVITEAGVRAAADTAEATTRAAAITTEIGARNAAIAAEAVLRVAADAAEVTARNTAIGVETSRATTAEALLAPKANPAFSGTVAMPIFTNAVNDAAAATAGVAIGQLYRSGSIVMQRIV